MPEASIAGIRLAPDLDEWGTGGGGGTAGRSSQGWICACRQKPGLRVKAAARAEGDVSEQLLFRNPRAAPLEPAETAVYDLELRLLSRGRSSTRSAATLPCGNLAWSGMPGPSAFYAQPRAAVPLWTPRPGLLPGRPVHRPERRSLRFDIEYAKKIGCNLIRKHVKIEPRRWYYHCDRLGMIAWQDMPNGGRPVGDVVSFLAITAG